MKKIEIKFLSTIRAYRMIEENDSILVGVSGGPDSVCLLHLLVRFRTKLNIRKIGAAHVNYRKRGKEADSDQRLVESLAADLDVPVYVKILSPGERKKLEVKNFQEKAREVRYRFFREIASREKFSKVATAHTLDDQAETVLMRFLAGAGVKGMKGIPKTTDDGFIRPLIEVSREEIIKYLEDEGCSYGVDRTNLENDFERNRMRNRVIPFLTEETGRDVKRTLVAAGEIFRQVDELMNLATDEAMKKSVSGDAIKVDRYLAYPELVRKALIQRLCLVKTGREISSRALKRADELLRRDFPSFSLSLPGGYVLRRSYDLAFIVKSTGEEVVSYEMVIEWEGDHVIPSLDSAVRVKIQGREQVKKVLKRIMEDSYTAAFEYAPSFFPLKVRNFLPGDTIVPFGMNSHRKLKKIYIERKIPRESRRHLPVFESSGEIVWVPGVIRSNHLLLGDGTEKIIVLEYKRR